jgi:hypothetical protein
MNTASGRVISAFFIAIIVIAFEAPGRAQTTFGSITETVLDPSGVAVPNTHVTVTNQATGSRQAVVTNAQGIFNTPDVQPGTGIVLCAHNIVNINISLSVGAATVSVEVTAAPPVLDTSSQTLSFSQTSAQLSEDYRPPTSVLRQRWARLRARSEGTRFVARPTSCRSI